jgi:hypothetical protein
MLSAPSASVTAAAAASQQAATGKGKRMEEIHPYNR